MSGNITHKRGFTVIEVVIVILVVGIISAVAMVRSLRSDTYNVAIARDQIVSMARSAQQKAIGRTDVELRLQPVGNELRLTIQDSNGVVQTATAPLSEVTLLADVNQLGSCVTIPGASAITPLSPFVLRYDYLGDLMQAGPAGSETDVSTGARICLNGTRENSICLSAIGYAYVGDCIDVD